MEYGLSISFDFLDDFFVKILPNGSIYFQKQNDDSVQSRMLTRKGNTVVFNNQNGNNPLLTIYHKNGEIESFKNQKWVSQNKGGFIWSNSPDPKSSSK
jgi:hypothetical protein